MTAGGRTGPQVEEALHNYYYSSGTGILEETISYGQMDIEDISPGSVVLHLRPVTDQAVKTLLNANNNNRLSEMIFEMLKKVKIANFMDGIDPLEIKVQVFYAKSTKSCEF